MQKSAGVVLVGAGLSCKCKKEINRNLSTRKFKNICMDNPAIVYIPPVKNNIIYFVSDEPKAGIQAAFHQLHQDS